MPGQETEEMWVGSLSQEDPPGRWHSHPNHFHLENLYGQSSLVGYGPQGGTIEDLAHAHTVSSYPLLRGCAFARSSADAHLPAPPRMGISGRCHVLVVMNSAVRNIGGHVSSQIRLLVLSS